MRIELFSQRDAPVGDNEGLQSWRRALGSQIRNARKSAGISQAALAEAVGKSRQIIGRYESGSDVPSVAVLGSIALQLSMNEIDINGYRFFVKRGMDKSPDSTEQLKLDFGKEHTYQGATIKITPDKVSITITAFVPAV
jgi:transcriptional regulator with XRE-family HTH domain